MQVKNLLSAVPRMLFTNAPLDAQLIVTRRCNLSCGYCHEYDNVSDPVPVDDLKRRIDALHRLGAANITLLGGEPLMHPDIAEIVVYAGHKSNVSLVTNGFLLRNGIIESLNEAGLNNLTVSVDTLQADSTRYIQKSFRSLKTRLERLRQLAKFDVHVTAVLCESSRDDFRQLVEEIQAMGFRMSVNLIHNSKGYIAVQGEPYLDLYEDFYRNGKPFTFLDYEYGKKLLQGETPDMDLPRRRPLHVRGRARKGAALRLAARPPRKAYRGVHQGGPERAGQARQRAARKAARSAVPSAVPCSTTTSQPL